MATTDQEPGILNSATIHSISDDTTMEDTCNEQTDQEGVHEEVLQHLRQALADANTFDSTSINYDVASEEPQVCDTGQVTENKEEVVTEVHSEESDLVVNSEAILQHTSAAIFSNKSQDNLLTNGSSEVLDDEGNGGYSVDTISEGHIISIPNDMISDSAIITQNGEAHLQTSIEIPEDSAVQLLQDESHQQLDLVGQVESSDYVQQSSETGILQDSGTSHEVLQTAALPQAHHAITLSAPSGMSMTPEVLRSVLQQVQAQHLATQRGQTVEAQPIHVKEELRTVSSPSSTSAPVNFTVVSPSQSGNTPGTSVSATGATEGSASAPPLGSSQNPIRIIQQGNRYTPMQHLSPEQLQQIMQVVQQQHVNKNNQDNGSAIIFNPQTNTRIMYRVIYPSELHKTQSPGGHTTYQIVRPSTASQEQQTGLPHQKRPYRRRKDMGTIPISLSGNTGGVHEEKDKAPAEGPDLSKEEKEERKKHRPRTRSGRVSKPPKHMVQDYKHIHVLDWDEDYDDSDGGYSDFKHSDEEGKVKQEGEEEELQSKSPDLFSGFGAVRPKNHKCQNCDKSYIGQAGLARHYRLNPDHCVNPSEDGSVSSMHNGSIDGDDSKDTPLAQDNSLSHFSDSALDMTATPIGPPSGSTNLETFSEDSNTQDSLNSTGVPSPHTVLPSTSHRGRGRGRFRGRWAHLKYNAHLRRKNRLKE
ncbi:Zinc finger protein 839-like, partial [Plakobranchus ocellatus]